MAKKMSQIVNQYAQAIYELANEQTNVDEVTSDLKALQEIFRANPHLAITLSSRELEPANQQKLIDILAKNATTSVQNLIKLLVANRRLLLLDEVIATFLDLYNQAQGIVDVQITTAIAVDDDQKGRLEEAFKRHSEANKLNPSYQVDPAIIGGVIMQSKSILVDGSLRTKITQMKAQLLG